MVNSAHCEIKACVFPPVENGLCAHHVRMLSDNHPAFLKSSTGTILASAHGAKPLSNGATNASVAPRRLARPDLPPAHHYNRRGGMYHAELDLLEALTVDSVLKLPIPAGRNKNSYRGALYAALGSKAAGDLNKDYSFVFDALTEPGALLVTKYARHPLVRNMETKALEGEAHTEIVSVNGHPVEINYTTTPTPPPPTLPPAAESTDQALIALLALRDTLLEQKEKLQEDLKAVERVIALRAQGELH